MSKLLVRVAVGAAMASGAVVQAQGVYGRPGDPVLLPVERSRPADVRVRAPFVNVQVGRDRYRPAPVVVARPVVAFQPAPPSPGLQPIPVERGYYPPAPPPPQGYIPAIPAPQPQIAAYVPARPMTHREFASCFVPTCGTHEVWLIHPKTCQPVRVCFTLPAGTPRKVRVERNELEFDYGRREVEIRFKNDGSVKVEYNH